VHPRHVPSTLTEALDNLQGHEDRGFTFVRPDASQRFVSFAEIYRTAGTRANALLARGLKKGDRVALVIPDGDEFILSFLGAVRAGLVPVPIFPQLTFRNLETYHETLVHIVAAAGAQVLVTTEATLQYLEPALEPAKLVGKVVTVEALKALPGESCSIQMSPEDLCFLQFTSGSTSKPKGVMVTHGNLAWNSECIMHHGLGKQSPHDRGVSWLPLFHDMGLIGFVIGPLFTDIQVTFLQTASFVRSPRIWLDTLSKQRGTITFAPNFAYQLVAKRLKEKDVVGLDLSCVRHAGCGAEPIHPNTLREFAEKLKPAGFDAKAFLASYGMAEATLAVTFTDQRGAGPKLEFDASKQRGLRTDWVDKQGLEDRVARSAEGDGAREIVNCGRAFPEHEVAVVDEAGTHLGDRQVGEIITRGPSISPGYFQDAEKTAEAFKDGWLHTGDLGYLVEGELYICGRAKDLIIVRGRNFYPSDIEWAVGELPRVRRGNVVAFGMEVDEVDANGIADRGEQLVVCAEAFQSDVAGLEEEIAQLVNERFQLTVHQVILAGQGTLPRTSSGKPQRRKTKAMVLDGAFAKPAKTVDGENETA
jgi:fatty-acyl-CoA synthase